MPYVSDPHFNEIFKLPDGELDDNTSVWRYMSFPKFVALLESRTLHFTRLDKFDDPSEGLYSSANVDLLTNISRPEVSATLEMIHRASETRSQFFANCWYCNKFESVAMWQLYGAVTSAIAVKSTFGRLKKSIAAVSESVHIVPVMYLDRDTQHVPVGNLFYPALCKGMPYKHESEIRAIVWSSETRPSNSPHGPLDPMKDRPEHGLNLDVNTFDLIEAVLVSPGSPSWYLQLTKSLVTKYGFNSDVVNRSAIS